MQLLTQSGSCKLRIAHRISKQTPVDSNLDPPARKAIPHSNRIFFINFAKQKAFLITGFILAIFDCRESFWLGFDCFSGFEPVYSSSENKTPCSAGRPC
ncbi:hypothetical protein CEXT_700251 [Caerostris extrusa]|uniref:Uncharacterized protein n=1 Tax=Caerostris extrusa TaxID=172846 RepID=A0AAV4UL25_CAEEX|nr:hypothetical protein CEXT_700251 [Caerostris extrusa]